MQIGIKLVVLLLVVLGPTAAYATECVEPFPKVTELTSGSAANIVLRTARLYRDQGGISTYDAILRADREGKFRWHCRPDLAPPDGDDALWVRVDLRRAAGAPSDWVFTFASTQIDEARLYQPQSGGLFTLKRTGRAVPRETRDLLSRWPAINLSLAENTTSAIYVRLSGITAPFMSVELVPADRFADRGAIDLLTLAAVLGFMIAMLAYNIVIYVRSRLHQCLYYFLYLGFMVLHIVWYDGLVYRFSDIRMTAYLNDALAQFSGVAAGACILMFGRYLLRLPTLAPRMDAVILLSTALLGLVVVLELVGLLPFALVSSLLPLAGGALMTGCACWFAFRGSRPAIYFTLSFVALLTGVALDMLGYFYPIALGTEPSLWTALIGVQQNWSFHIGICAEALLISFAITYFIRDMQTDVVQARAEADQTRQETMAARQEFTEKYTDLAQRVGIVNADDPARETASSSDDTFHADAVRAVQDNLGDETFDVTKLAASLAVSERTLRRRMRDVADMSPVEFLRRQRLEKAREFLQNGSYQTVAEAARAVGINSPGYFSRVYKEAFGQSPRDALKSR